MEVQAYRYGAWAGVGFIALAMVFEALRGHGIAVAVLGLFLSLSLLVVFWRRPGPGLFDALFVGAALLNAVGYMGDLYGSLYFFDELAHLVTAFTITAAFGTLVYRPVLPHFRQRQMLLVMVLASFGLSTGALWEIFEYAAHIRVDLADTVSDLAFDAVGAVLGAVLAVRLSYRSWSPVR